MRLFATFLAAALVLTAAAVPAGAVPAPLEETVPGAAGHEVSSDLVLRIQRGLSRLGFYTGRAHGRLDAKTRAAIRVYQQSRGDAPDGRATPGLADALDYALGVRHLLQRLDVTREEGRSEAREKLLAHPATRDLLDPERKAEAADPTRDPAPCFRRPTVLCLVTEARESAKAVFKAELRDWVLGDILIAEARAGLSERAMDTASRIKDPRLIVVALRDIAEAKAAGGDAEDAVAAAEIIPDAAKRAEALLAIAAIQVRRGDAAAAETTFARLAEAAGTLDDPVRRIELRTREAALRFEAGDKEFAAETLKAAEAEASALADTRRLNALRHVATAHAAIARSDRDLQALGDLGRAGAEMPVLMAAVNALAAAGELAPARAAAERLSEARFRALALGRLALAHHAVGETDTAMAAIDEAEQGLDRIEKPFARDFARSRLALARLALAAGSGDDSARRRGFERAVELARDVADARLRAETLWRISYDRRRGGDAEGAASVEPLAQRATDDILGDVSRVWMFADLALAEVNMHPKAAGAFFERALTTAERVRNPWARARSLAKLSTTLLTLVDPGRGRPPADGEVTP